MTSVVVLHSPLDNGGTIGLEVVATIESVLLFEEVTPAKLLVDEGSGGNI